MKYRKLIYTAFDYYSKRRDKLLSGGIEKQQLTEEDKKILKTLGICRWCIGTR